MEMKEGKRARSLRILISMSISSRFNRFSLPMGIEVNEQRFLMMKQKKGARQFLFNIRIIKMKYADNMIKCLTIKYLKIFTLIIVCTEVLCKLQYNQTIDG